MKITFKNLTLAVLLMAATICSCNRDEFDDTTVDTEENAMDFDCPNFMADIGDSCQNGWGIVDDDCECVEDTSLDCPDLDANIGDDCVTSLGEDGVVSQNCDCEVSTNTVDCPDLNANIGDPCQDGWGIVDDNCECIENVSFDCPNLDLNIGDPCQDGWGIVDDNCECIENSTVDCPDLNANIGDDCLVGGEPGTVSDDCECVEESGEEFDCPNFSADIGDPCQQGWGIISEDCDCLNANSYDCPGLGNYGSPCTTNDGESGFVTENCGCE